MKILTYVLCAFIACGSLVGCGGCSSTGSKLPTISNEVGAALVKNARRAALTANDVFQTYLQYEAKNRKLLWSISKEFKAKADYLRQPVPDPTKPGEQVPPSSRMVARCDSLTLVVIDLAAKYEANETPEGRQTLQGALDTLLAVMDDVQRLQLKAKGE